MPSSVLATAPQRQLLALEDAGLTTWPGRQTYGAAVRTVFLAMSFPEGCSLKNDEDNKPW